MPNKNPGDIMASPSGGMLHSLVIRLKLILKLMGDRRVSPFLKLIPIGTLIYLISPVDIIMGIPGIDALDDAAVVGLGAYLFIELCPPNVVQEHMKSLASPLASEPPADEIVDAETTELPNDQK